MRTDEEVFNNIDWELLAAQKHQLVKVDFTSEAYPPALVAAARGLVGFLDAFQDAAEAATGLPVARLTPANEAELTTKLEAEPGKAMTPAGAAEWIKDMAVSVQLGVTPEGGCHFRRLTPHHYELHGYVRVDPSHV